MCSAIRQSCVLAFRYYSVIIIKLHLSYIFTLSFVRLLFVPAAHGVFEVTHDITRYTKAKIFEHIGKQTPMFIRFSTVGKGVLRLFRISIVCFDVDTLVKYCNVCTLCRRRARLGRHRSRSSRLRCQILHRAWKLGFSRQQHSNIFHS